MTWLFALNLSLYNSVLYLLWDRQRCFLQSYLMDLYLHICRQKFTNHIIWSFSWALCYPTYLPASVVATSGRRTLTIDAFPSIEARAWVLHSAAHWPLKTSFSWLRTLQQLLPLSHLPFLSAKSVEINTIFGTVCVPEVRKTIQKKWQIS